MWASSLHSDEQGTRLGKSTEEAQDWWRPSPLDDPQSPTVVFEREIAQFVNREDNKTNRRACTTERLILLPPGLSKL